MTQITGRVAVIVNGQRLRSREGATLNMGGVQRQAALSDSGVDGYTEATVVPRVECAINHTPQISLTELADFKDGTLVFETDSGVIFTVRDAYCAEPPKLASKGEVTLVFEGTECIEG